VWPPLLVVSVLIFIVSYATFNALSPVMEAEIQRQMAKAMQSNPQFTQEMADRSRGYYETLGKLGSLVYPLYILVLGVAAWLIGKLVGSRQTLHAALVVASYTSIITVLELLTNGIQAMVTDLSRIPTAYALALGPAHLVDAATISPFVYAVLIRLNIFAVWRTILLSIGWYATGKVSKSSAAIAGFIIWCLVLIWQFRQVLAMR
jgi:hypothetical protein